MKTELHSLIRLFLFAVVISLVTSCGEIEYSPSGTGDALIITRVTDTDTLFGLGLHAYTYDVFSSVTAYYANGDSGIYNLEPFEGYKNDLSYETPLNEMKHYLPPAGEYSFDAEFPGGEFLIFSDILASDYTLPPRIKSCQYDSSLKQVVVYWDEITDAGVVSVRLYSMQDSLLFMGQAVEKTAIVYTFGKNTQGWVSETMPEAGIQYQVEISTYIFEPLSGGSLNLQATGRIRKTITWGS